MKRIPILAALSVIIFAGAGCTSSDASGSELAAPAERTTPEQGEAAFVAWLGEQCPNGMLLQRTDLRTGMQRVISCEDARATVVTNERAHSRLLEVYEQSGEHSIASRVPDLGEAVGEVRQPWSLVGVACSLVTTGLGLAFNWPGSRTGCNDPRANHPDACAKVTTLGAAALGVVCWFL